MALARCHSLSAVSYSANALQHNQRLLNECHCRPVVSVAEREQFPEQVPRTASNSVFCAGWVIDWVAGISDAGEAGLVCKEMSRSHQRRVEGVKEETTPVTGPRVFVSNKQKSKD
jgi:hypothetical protein